MGIFGIHGTRTPENVISIAENNLNPSIRRSSGGEYYAVDV